MSMKHKMKNRLPIYYLNAGICYPQGSVPRYQDQSRGWNPGTLTLAFTRTKFLCSMMWAIPKTPAYGKFFTRKRPAPDLEKKTDGYRFHWPKDPKHTAWSRISSIGLLNNYNEGLFSQLNVSVSKSHEQHWQTRARGAKQGSGIGTAA
jgi:hypothetical protein